MYFEQFAKELAAFVSTEAVRSSLTEVRVEPGLLVASDGCKLITLQVARPPKAEKFKPFSITVPDLKSVLSAIPKHEQKGLLVDEEGLKGKAVLEKVGKDTATFSFYRSKRKVTVPINREHTFPDYGTVMPHPEREAMRIHVDPDRLRETVTTVCKAVRGRVNNVTIRIFRHKEAPADHPVGYMLIMEGKTESGQKVKAVLMGLNLDHDPCVSSKTGDPKRRKKEVAKK